MTQNKVEIEGFKWIYYKKHLLQGKIKCSDCIYDFYHF